MSKRVISTNAADVAQALNDLEGYPRDPTHRGSACPPAPFGRTAGYVPSNIVVDGVLHEGAAVVDEAALDRHHGKMARGVTIRRDLGIPLPDAVPVDVGPGRGARR